MNVYLDCVFLLNAVMDYLLCLLTARLAGLTLRRFRYLLSAFVGAIYATAVFLPIGSSLSHPLIKISVAILMALIAYRGEQKLLRLILLFLLVSCILAGAVLGLGVLLGEWKNSYLGLLHRNPKPAVLITAVFGIWLLLKLVFQPSIQNGVQGRLISVRVSIAEQLCSANALWDTGNQLRDSANGQAVLVISREKVSPLLPKEIQTKCREHPDISASELVEIMHSYALKPCLLPYSAVGLPSGMLPAIRADWVEIDGVRYQNMTVALAPFAFGNGYDALWGGDLKRGGIHEISEKTLSIPEKKPVFRSGNLLHWGQ